MRLKNEQITDILIEVSKGKIMWWKAQEKICAITGIDSKTGRSLVKKSNDIHNVIGSVGYWTERCEILTEIWNTSPQLPESELSKEHVASRMKYHEFMIKTADSH